MSKQVPDCLYEMATVRLAFHTGQVVEEMLLDRSLELARQTGSSRVTPDHVNSCVDEALFASVLQRVRENANGGTADKGEFREGGSWEAA